MKKKLVFMGTPQFSVAILEALSKLDCDVCAVVTQPDRPVGRKQILTAPPVKQKALEFGYPVYQPESIKDLKEHLTSLDLDLIVTCAYGQFIPQSILDLPRYGCVNIHASLLPAYRGGAPIHQAVMNGDSKTGISIMRMVKKMDAGDVLFQCEVPIHEDDTMGTVHDRLSQCGATLLTHHFDDLFRNDLGSTPQDESKVSYAYNISPEQEFVSFERPSFEVSCHIRGLSPWPLAYGLLEGKKVKFYFAKVGLDSSSEPAGTILGLREAMLCIKTLDGCVLIPELQVEGKIKMSAADVWQGYGLKWKGLVFASHA